jgi:hypothetical protein
LGSLSVGQLVIAAKIGINELQAYVVSDSVQVSMLPDLEGGTHLLLWSGAVIWIFNLVRTAELHEDAFPVPRIGDARYTRVALESGAATNKAGKTAADNDNERTALARIDHSLILARKGAGCRVYPETESVY